MLNVEMKTACSLEQVSQMRVHKKMLVSNQLAKSHLFLSAKGNVVVI